MIRSNRWLVFGAIVFLLYSNVKSQEVLDKIVAVVDDKIILFSELNQFTYQMSVQMGVNPQNEVEKFKQLRKNALETLVNQKVLLTKAQEDSIFADERQVDQILEERLNLITRDLGSEEKVEEYFGQPLRKIRRTLRKDIADNLMVRSLQQLKFREVRVSRREVEDFYEAMKDSLPKIKESVKISHILIDVQPGDEALSSARSKLEEIKKRIENGEDFGELAEQYSEDPGSSKRGGELGFIQRGDFVRDFEEAAFALQPGEISDIVRSQFGFHLIQLIDRRGEKINARHILISVPRSYDDDERTRERLLKIRDEITSGQLSFEDAAEKYSTDVTTNENGGDLGWFEIDQLQVEEFKDAVENLKEGEISAPIKTQFGFHLIRLDERREPRDFNLADDWQQVEEMARSQKAEKRFRAWLEELKEDTYIRLAEEY